MLKTRAGTITVLSPLAACLLALVVVPGTDRAQPAPTPAPARGVANAPDDLSPTPEERLAAAGVALTVPAMSALVLDPAGDPELRYWAALALGRSGQARASAPLLQALDDPLDDMRYGAVVALGTLGPRAALPALARALDDGDAAVRSVAVEALGRLGGSGSVSHLAAKLADAGEREVAIRARAATELGRLGGARARAALAAALTDGAVPVRAAAAFGLARLDDRAALPALVAIALDPLSEEWVRVDAIGALETMTGQRFAYTRPHSAPTSEVERAAALARLARWWRQNG